MPEPEVNANDRDQQASLAQDLWQDKVLADAIGYTKGLVAILDSLSDGFQRRGRELEEQRHRLAILQSERRTILEGRSGLDTQIASLTAERDELRSGLEAREQELDKLRKEVATRQSTLDGHTRELEELKHNMAEPARQAEELREVVRSLERQLQRAGQVPSREPLSQVAGDAATPGDGRTTSQPDLAGLESLVPDNRAPDDSQIISLTAERDALRAKLEERGRELDQLGQEVVQGKAALEAQTREIHALRVGMTETVRQAEEIQKVLQGLEQEREGAAHRQAILEAELEVERRRVRETTARASQEQIALREDLADAENLLAEARKDIAAGQGLIASLRRTVEEERSRNAARHEHVQPQTLEVSRLSAAIHGAQTLLMELTRALGGGEAASSVEGREWAELEALVQDPEAVTKPDRGALTMLQSIVDALGDIWQPAGGKAPLNATDEAALRRRAEDIADQWRRLLQERTAQPPQEEPQPLSVDAATTKSEREVRRDGQRAVPTRDRRTSASEGVREGKHEPSPAPAVASAARQKTSKRRSAVSGMTVECMLVASGKDAPRILRGEIARVNNMGLLGAFDERFPDGRQVVVRFVRDGEVVSCLGRVVRVQESTATSDLPAVCNHLIRFESQPSASGEELQAFGS